MCTSVCPVSLLVAVVVACVVNPAPVVCQCTTGHCHDDGDNDVSVLTAMVSRLQDTVEQLQGQLELQQQLFLQLSDSTERRQQQLQEELRNSTEENQKQFTKLWNAMAKQEEPLKRHAPPRDCYDLLMDGHNVSGVYEVYLAKARRFVRVYCDMDSDGHAWLVFQRRQDGYVDFYRDWATYKAGFGEVDGEFWLGNDYLNDITSQGQYVLRIDMEDFEDENRYAVYSTFAVGAELQKYKLTLGTYSGTAGDSLTQHHGQSFSTKDQDNDASSTHCAESYKGGWWYAACHHSNLNGLYLRGHHDSYADGVEWYAWHQYHYSLQKVEMKLRPLR